MDVSVIIVNYNTRQLLADCLRTVREHTLSCSYEVIVVDNGSTDGSELLVAEFPWIKWINAGANLGFGRANNLGAESATGKYLFFLNSDTLLGNDAVDIFFRYMEAHGGEVGAIGTFLTDATGKPALSGGSFPSVAMEWHYLFGFVFRRKAVPAVGEVCDVDMVTGADLFMPKSVFMRLGGFDPAIFMYYEETDLQLRMSRLGLKARLVPGAAIKHLEGGSFGHKGLTPARFEMSQKSYNYYVDKHYGGVARAWYRLNMLLLRATVLFYRWPLAERFRAYRTVVANRK